MTSIALALVTSAVVGTLALTPGRALAQAPALRAVPPAASPGDAPQQAVAGPVRQAPPLPPGPPPAERRPLPTANVKVDVTITDQTGTRTPMKKMVSMIVADGHSSSVRSVTGVPLWDGGGRELPLNVDASVNVTPDRRVLLELRFNYSSVSLVAPIGVAERSTVSPEQQRDMSAPRPSQSTITENLHILLTPGTPSLVAQSADAAADRKVTVEVTAEILK